MPSTASIGRAVGHELVERDLERGALTFLLDQAQAGRGGVALIEGVAGAGKTALIDAGGDFGAERGMRILRGRGSEIDREAPLSLLRGLFERALAEITALRGESIGDGAAAALAGALGPRPGQATGDRRLRHEPWLRQAAYSLVAELARHEPVVLLVDDLQWADPVSAAALGAIGHRLYDLPVALVAARTSGRREIASTAVAELSTVAGVRLNPAPLSRPGVAAVLRHHLGATPLDERTADVAFEATGGNPFLVVQLAAALVDAGQSLDPPGLVNLVNGVSRALSSVLRVRVGRLGHEAVAVAQAVAVLGDDRPISEVCGVAGLGREAALRAAAALAGSGIFATERVAAFAHPLVRAAVDADLLAADRARLEERAVRELLEAGADPGRVAEHLLHTDPAGNPRAVTALRAAAGAASAAAAPARAAVLLRRALAELPEGSAQPGLLDEVIAAELGAGSCAQLTGHLRSRLAGEVTPGQRASLIRWLARVVMQIEGIPAAVDLLDRELPDLEGDGRLLVEAERATMLMLYPPMSHRLREPVARYAHLRGDTPGERAMLAVVGVALSCVPGQSAGVVAPIVARAFDEGGLLSDDHPGSHIYGVAAYGIMLTDQLELAERELSRAMRAARESGVGSGLALASTIRAMTRLQLGRIDEAEADGLAAIEGGRPPPGSLQALAFGRAVGVVVEARAARGDDGGAMRALIEHGFVGELGADPELRVLISRARAHLAAGRPAEALADARRRQAAFHGHGDVPSHAAPTEALALLALGDRAAARVTAEAHLHRARVWGTASTVAAALRVNGLVCGGPGGVAMLEEALGLLDGSPARMEAARCLVALGMLHRRCGHRAAALAQLRGGAHLANDLGARRLAEQARDELRVLGARPRRLALSGPAALTAAERRIAELAAGGGSNRDIARELFVSLKTVETHLGRAYRKLDIRSRDQLAAALAP